MKQLLVVFLLMVGITDPVTKIAKSNKLKKEAKAAFEMGDYEKAIDKYLMLLDSMEVEDPAARLNLANAAYFISFGGENLGLMNDISAGKIKPQDSTALSDISGKLQFFDIAESNYKQLKDVGNKLIASSAFNQLGIIAYKMSQQSKDQQKTFIETALSRFKNAIRKNPKNESARYNYELLKKLSEQQQEQEQQQQDQNQEQQQKDQQDKQEQNNEQQKKEEQNQEGQDKQEQEQKEQQQKEEQQDQQQGKGEEQEQEQEEQQNEQKQDKENQDEQQDGQEEKEDPMQQILDKLKEMNISQEKAQMILEAMKNNEIQYIQQNQRKASKRKDRNKPDW